MPLLDFFKKDKNDKKPIQFIELGATGTRIFSGILNEEFNPDLIWQNGVEIFNKMRKNDAQVFASLQAVKLPLLSARWFIQPATGDDVNESEAEEQAKFIEENLFEKLKWKKQLRLILTYLDFGYKYLEKVFGINEEGKIIWAKWGDRQQSAHWRWQNDEGIIGAQQQLPNIEADNQKMQPFTPMTKLLLFSLDREGDNYEGVSLLRAAYKHWWYKDTLYKIQGIQAERYGVGLPTTTMGENNSADDKNKAEEQSKNLRSNETSFLVLPYGWDFKIITPDGNAQGQSIENAISHHNRMILMNVLASFLDLGSGSSGSFALSKEQGSFFMLGLQSIADDIKDIVNDAIKELILLNWPNTKKFPKLDVTDIAQVDPELFANMLNTLSVSGFIKPDIELKKFVRNSLKFPEMSSEEEEKGDEDLDVDNSIEPEEIEDEMKKEEEKKKKNDKFAELLTGETNGHRHKAEFSSVTGDGFALIGNTDHVHEIKNFKILESKGHTHSLELQKKKLADKKMIPEREKQFYSDIEKNEATIESDYLPFESELVKTESQLKKFLNNKFDRAETRIDNGVEVIKRSFRLTNEIKSGINDIMRKFRLRVSGGTLSAKIMKDVAKNAIISSTKLKRTKEFAPALLIAEPQIRSFLAGHISNMNGVVLNEGRQTFEKMQENIGQEVSLRLTKDQISKIKFNRNIFKLSVTAHPRGLFRSIIGEDARKVGINHFKAVVPPNRKKDIKPSGNIAMWLFLIFTAQQINERSGTKDNVNAVGGLGLNHNSFEYYYPIDEDNMNEEQALAKEQRAEFNKSLK